MNRADVTKGYVVSEGEKIFQTPHIEGILSRQGKKF